MAQERLVNHILPNSATMIGVCVTLVGLVKIAEAHIGPSQVDVYCALNAVVFLISAFSSYLSLRLQAADSASRILERVADVCFMAGLVALTCITILFAYEVI